MSAVDWGGGSWPGPGCPADALAGPSAPSTPPPAPPEGSQGPQRAERVALPYRYPDGSNVDAWVSYAGNGTWLLSDRGETVGLALNTVRETAETLSVDVYGATFAEGRITRPWRPDETLDEATKDFALACIVALVEMTLGEGAVRR